MSTPILVLFLLKAPRLFSLAAPSTPSLPIIVTHSLSLARAGLGWAGCSICPGKMWRKCGFVPGIATYWESLRRKLTCQYPEHHGENRRVLGRDVINFMDVSGHTYHVCNRHPCRIRYSFYVIT